MVVTNHILKPRGCRWTLVPELSLDRESGRGPRLVAAQLSAAIHCQLVTRASCSTLQCALHLSPDKAIPALPRSTPRQSEEEADERAVTQRIHEFFGRMQKVTDVKRKGEAKAWTQLKTFWMAVVRGLGVLGEMATQFHLRARRN